MADDDLVPPYDLVSDEPPPDDDFVRNQRRRGARRIVEEVEESTEDDCERWDEAHSSLRELGRAYVGIGVLSLLCAGAMILLATIGIDEASKWRDRIRILGILYAFGAISIVVQTIRLFHPTYRGVYGRRGFVSFVVRSSLGITPPLLLPLTLAAYVWAIRVLYRPDVREYMRLYAEPGERHLWG
jgi:hypothetical protein